MPGMAHKPRAAVANFPISGRGPDKDFVLAHVRIKLAAARANCQPGWLSEEKRDAIVAACDKILAGEYIDQFVVDRFQAGAGTSHNMNSNEVIANLASVALGGEKGSYKPVNPNDDVNMGNRPTTPFDCNPPRIAGQAARLTAAVHSMAAEFSRMAEREKDTVRAAAPICRTQCQPRWGRNSPAMRGHSAVAPQVWTPCARRCAKSAGRFRRRHRAQHLARLPGARRGRTGKAHQ